MHPIVFVQIRRSSAFLFGNLWYPRMPSFDSVANGSHSFPRVRFRHVITVFFPCHVSKVGYFVLPCSKSARWTRSRAAQLPTKDDASAQPPRKTSWFLFQPDPPHTRLRLQNNGGLLVALALPQLEKAGLDHSSC